jgi:hypothetical protein
MAALAWITDQNDGTRITRIHVDHNKRDTDHADCADHAEGDRQPGTARLARGATTGIQRARHRQGEGVLGPSGRPSHPQLRARPVVSAKRTRAARAIGVNTRPPAPYPRDPRPLVLIRVSLVESA